MRTLLLLAAASLCAAEFPEAQISNGAITAKFYLPDAEKGYYRGTRFDWSGQISSLKTKNHEYFGQWFEKYDPKLHDAIMGPVEEFITGDTSLGYEQAEPGGTFVRIGVGTVRKPNDEKRYQRFRTYEIVDPGRWTIRPGKDRIEFVHELTDAAGYSYRYTKIVRLQGKKPEMVIEHRLKNTGKKAIPTLQYNHNFFVMDNAPTGPDTIVRFPFAVKPKTPFTPGYAEVREGEIAYLKELTKGVSVFSQLDGFSDSPKDFDFRVENRAAGAGVRVQGDQPISKIVFWSIRTTVCAEPYIDVSAGPGEEKRWTYRYTFYDAAK